MSEMRLQRFLAQCGVASRRKAEDIIRSGRVSVNGVQIIDMGYKVLASDEILVDGEKVCPEEKKVYIMLNKPVGYVTTARDQFARKTALDLVSGIRERVFPVGRLDYDTSGLLILTNDGNFTYRMTHPRHEVEKVYRAEVVGVPSGEELAKFEEGLDIEDYRTSPSKIRIIREMGKTSIVEIVIHEGKNRQIRKMCEAIMHPVLTLRRVAVGGVELGSLPEGEWRYLKDDEIKSLL